MFNLFDVIDQDYAEQMLEQHDRYEFGHMAVVRDKKDRRRWWVYWRSYEVHIVDNPRGEPESFPGLAEALDYALSPATRERLEAGDAVDGDNG